MSELASGPLSSPWRTRLEQEGFALIPEAVSAETVESLLRALPSVESSSNASRRGGVRNLLEDVPEVQALALHGPLRDVAERVLGRDCFAVRGLMFDKTPESNWKVIWHQDLTIAVRERREVPGFGPWSHKAGVECVQPPPEVLESMVAVRLHLDDCGSDNGPVRVLPGSHREGRLSSAQTQTRLEQQPAEDCLVSARGILVMRPLLLHASSPARVPAHRRVVHLEFAACELPAGLEWHTRIGGPGHAQTQGVANARASMT
ncbi:phytanoyl-CoA dioxygenase family protein [Myxococcaceae bacterium JPH2]|nr:phytanoyl-CoA dioxygenase family protein [Myxococcaceae bacterium JPH2]